MNHLVCSIEKPEHGFAVVNSREKNQKPDVILDLKELYSNHLNTNTGTFNFFFDHLPNSTVGILSFQPQVGLTL